MAFNRALLSLSLLLIAGCSDLYPATPHPDYSIKVMPTATGMAAIPPECASWATDTVNPYDNQTLPQFGCASARNLALMVENPEDLVHGRDMGTGRAVTTVGAVRRYDNNQTRGILDLGSSPDSSVAVTTSSAPSSSMSGDAASGGGSAAASSSSSAAAPAAAAGP